LIDQLKQFIKDQLATGSYSFLVQRMRTRLIELETRNSELETKLSTLEKSISEERQMLLKLVEKEQSQCSLASKSLEENRLHFLNEKEQFMREKFDLIQ
jgi:hypothetical protein